MTKRLLCPSRLRHVPRQFSWIDHRLLRDGYFERCGGPPALALYLLLITAADAQGLSYYSERSIARLLTLPEGVVPTARRALLAAGLIAYEAPLYQVLSLQPAPALAAARPAARAEAAVTAPAAPRTGEPLHLSEILRQLFAASEASAGSETSPSKGGAQP